MKTILLVVLGLAALIGGYEGWAYHQRALGKLELAVADDVSVRKIEKARDVALVTLLTAQLDTARRSQDVAVGRERRRATTVLAADSAADVTDSTIAAAREAIEDSTTKAKLDSVALVVQRERQARDVERAESDSTIEAWRVTALRWRLVSDSTGALAGSRQRRIDALEAENRKIRSLLPSKTGSWLRLAATASTAVLACRHIVRC